MLEGLLDGRQRTDDLLRWSIRQQIQWQQLELVQHRVRAFQLRAAALEADLAPVGVNEQFVDGRLGAV
ncbi:hypothetical protein OX89_15325 [Diaphorobacter sp. J5-51]|nr:hypothetical protein OX89_15325 [Diaphorobacter sp. J5-51]